MRKVIASVVIFVFSFLVFLVPSVSAKVITDQAGSVNIGKTEVVNDDLFIGARMVEIAGTVNGDVFVGAQTVKISGTVNGNLHVGANTFDLSGTVKGNVYSAGQNILVSGSKIGGSLIAGGATVNVDKDSVIGGSVLAGTGMLTVDSQVKRSIYAGTENLTIGSNAKIGGSVYKSEVNTAQNNANIESAKKKIPGVLHAARVFTALLSLVGVLIIGFLYMKLFGKHFEGTVKILSESFWRSLGVGFLVSISFIPGLIILLVTVIGIPVAGIAILMLILYSYLAKIVVGSVLGNTLSQKMNWKMSAYGAFAFGIFLIYLLKMIPMVGALTGLAVLWSGLGALTLRMFSKSE